MQHLTKASVDLFRWEIGEYHLGILLLYCKCEGYQCLESFIHGQPSSTLAASFVSLVKKSFEQSAKILSRRVFLKQRKSFDSKKFSIIASFRKIPSVWFQTSGQKKVLHQLREINCDSFDLGFFNLNLLTRRLLNTRVC